MDREQLPARSSDEWQVYVQNVEGDLAALTDPDPDRGCDTAGVAAALLHKHQLSADLSSPEGQLLRAYLRRSVIQIERWRYARLHGEYRDVIEDGLFASYPASRPTSHPTQEAARIIQPSSGKMLDTDIVDLWAEERKPVEKGVYDHRSAAQWLYKRVDRKPVDQLTEDDFRKFKSRLLEEGKSPANIRQKLSRLSTLMQWAYENRHINGNPVKGVTIKVTKSGISNRLGVCARRCHRVLHGRFDDPARWLRLLDRVASRGCWARQLSMDPASQFQPYHVTYADAPFSQAE